MKIHEHRPKSNLLSANDRFFMHRCIDVKIGYLSVNKSDIIDKFRKRAYKTCNIRHENSLELDI